MDVLRHLYETLAPGGAMLDLRSVPPPSLVEVDGKAIGKLDESEFFPRSKHNGDALAAFAAEGLLTLESEARHEILIVYPTGRNLVDDVADWGSTKVPETLAVQLMEIDRECRIREFCLARAYRKSA